MSEIKRMNIAEFREDGYLHEINRLYLHPLGMALEVVIEDDGTERLGGVWDYRDEAEGMVFGEDLLNPELALKVFQTWNERQAAREAAVGFMIQPVEGIPELNLSYNDVKNILDAFDAAGPAWVPGALRAKLELFVHQMDAKYREGK